MRALRGMTLAAMLSLAGCAAHRAYKDAVALQATGDVVAAAQRYLGALDRRPGYLDAQVGLRGVAQQAWDARYAEAAKAEQAMDFETARTRYMALARYEAHLKRFGVGFSPKVNTQQKIDAMSHGAAQRAYTLGVQSHRQGRFAEAIALFRAALKFVPHLEDTEQRIARTWFDWGAADEGAGRWRDAVAHYDRAGTAGLADGTVRAAEILAALGRYHLDRHACRQAATDLQSAADRVAGSVDADLAHARACAEVRVAVALGADPHRDYRRDRHAHEGQPRLEEVLTERLPQVAGPFVTMVSPMALQGPLRLPNGRLVVDRVVYGTLPSDEVRRPEPDSREVRAEAQGQQDCVDDSGAQTTCTVDVDVVYDLVHRTADTYLSANLQVMQVRDGVVLGTHAFDGSAHAEVWWAEDLRDAGTGKPLAAAYESVSLPQDLQDLVDTPHDLPPSSILVQQAADALAARAVPWAASLLLPPEDDTDPTTLQVREFPTVMHRPR